MAKKASFFKTWNLQMNKYLFIHKFQILKKYAQELANKTWQVLKIALPPKAIFCPSPRQKSLMSKWQVLKIAHTKKRQFCCKKNLKCLFSRFFVFFAIFTRFLCFRNFFVDLRSRDGYPSIRGKFEKEIAILTKWVKSQINGKFKWVFSSKLPIL